MATIEQVQDLIDQSSNIVFFGGAGVSTESGIPDFRSANGLYNQEHINFKPEFLLSYECLYQHPTVFYEYYRNNFDFTGIEPNITHKYLAQLEQQGKLKTIITQNIDGLHQAAGSQNVIELHGTVNRNYCIECGEEVDSDYIFRSRGIPRCPNCEPMNDMNWIRPDIVLYGEALDMNKLYAAQEAIRTCDLLIIAGTSLVVQPAASLPNYMENGHIIVINRELINLPLYEGDLFVQQSAGEIFSRLKINDF